MSKITLIAAAMWQEEARRAGTLRIVSYRTYEAFENEATELQDKWIRFAKVALKTIEEFDT
jgi:phosphoserine phosphatase